MNHKTKTHIILVRHGQIQANLDKRWHGWTDSPLTAIGRSQAQAAGKRLAAQHQDISAIYASPLQRTRHTAEAIANQLAKPVTLMDDLKEYGLGIWEGETFADLHKQYDFFENVKKDRHYAPEQGESIQQVYERVAAALGSIAEKHRGEKVLAVSHGAAMALALSHFLDANPYAWENYQFNNTSVTELMLGDNAELLSFNCDKHLEDLEQ